jgi:hypothetical protein
MNAIMRKYGFWYFKRLGVWQFAGSLARAIE